MMVTREFARDHGLKLPDGYYRDKGQERPKKSRQLSLYEKSQQDKGGLTKEQHMAQVTAAWHRRDTPRAFVRSLEDMGYILATGTRDYVLVDLYGNMNSLPKLIDDKKVRIKEVREFLGKDFPKDSLPTVDEARALAAGASRGDGAVQQGRGTGRPRSRRERAPRGVAAPAAAAPSGRGAGGEGLADRQRRPGMNSRAAEAERRRSGRAICRRAGASDSTAPRTGRRSAAFLGRITGVELITKKIHSTATRPGTSFSSAAEKELAERQQREAAALERRQQLETLTMQRRLRALELVEKRELRSLETSLLKERRIEERERTGRVPSPPEPVLTPDEAPEKPIDVTAEFEKASAEPAPTHMDEFNRAAKEPIDLTAEFERASGSGEGEGEASGEAVAGPRARGGDQDSSGVAARGTGRRMPSGQHRGRAPTGTRIMTARRLTIRHHDGDAIAIWTAGGKQPIPYACLLAIGRPAAPYQFSL